jgi:hypothetical protein
VQDISILSSRTPSVRRPAGARHVYLTFEGLRESRTISDKRTRLNIALPVSTAVQLRELLAHIEDEEQQ